MSNEEQTQTLSLRAAYAFGAARGLEAQVNDIRNMVIEWDAPYTSSLRRGYIVDLFEKHGIFEDFKREHWSFGNTSSGQASRRRFLRIRDQYEEFLVGRGAEPASDDMTAQVDSRHASEFALEAHLRDFLARNMEHIEAGLRLYDSGGRTGVEFPVDSGRIDLLAVDRNGKYVVIELKLSYGRNKALGQLLYYMGWVDQNMGGGPVGLHHCERDNRRAIGGGCSHSGRELGQVSNELLDRARGRAVERTASADERRRQPELISAAGNTA